jgi:hypothetical protein
MCLHWPIYSRSFLYVAEELVANDPGLHGMVEKCG